MVLSMTEDFTIKDYFNLSEEKQKLVVRWLSSYLKHDLILDFIYESNVDTVIVSHNLHEGFSKSFPWQTIQEKII